MNQRNTRDTIFPEISDNIILTIILSGFLMFALWISQDGQFREGYDPFVLFSLTLLLVTVIGVSQRTEDPINSFIEAAGFKEPLPGWNILLFSVGIGVGMLTFNLTSSAMSVWGVNSQAASLIQPLYNQFTAFPTEFSLTGASGDLVELILIQFVIIATGEEIFKIYAGKNSANWLYTRFGLRKGAAISLGIFWALLFWAIWHFLSWELGIGAIFTAIIYGVIFYLPWLFSDFIGSINPGQRITLTEIPAAPAIGTHGTWNVLVTTGGTGLGFATNTALGLSLVLIPSAIMLVIKQRYEIPFFPQPEP